MSDSQNPSITPGPLLSPTTPTIVLIDESNKKTGAVSRSLSKLPANKATFTPTEEASSSSVATPDNGKEQEDLSPPQYPVSGTSHQEQVDVDQLEQDEVDFQYQESSPLSSLLPTRPTLPPSFSSLFHSSAAAPAYVQSTSVPSSLSSPGSPAEYQAFYPPPEASSSVLTFQEETKRALPADPKRIGESSKDEDSEPPPAYEEGSSPLLSFSYLMAAAGGAASIITQVQQGGPPIQTLSSDVGLDETIAMDLRYDSAPHPLF